MDGFPSANHPLGVLKLNLLDLGFIKILKSMQLIRLSWSLLMGFCLVFSANAQETQDEVKLPRDPEEFVDHIEDKFSKLQSDQAELALETFVEDWETGKYKKEEQKAIMELEVFMDQERYRPSRGYQTYLEALNIAKASEIGFSALQEWHKVLNKLVEEEQNDFNTFNETLKGFFKDKAIYTSRTKSWHVSTDALNIQFEDKPYLAFENVTLNCIGQKDSINITNTTGRMDVLEKKWEGKGGKITWAKVGLSPNKVYAELSNYNIPLRRGELEADSVSFHNSNFMDQPLEGSLKDKLSSLPNNRAQFPQFNSYQASYDIHGLFDNITYRGGFAMKGRQVAGTGTEDKRAEIEVIKNSRTQFLAKSKRFTIDPEGIDAQRSTSTIYFKGDSLYHSNIRLKYRDSTKLMTLIKEDGLGESPLKSSFHNLEINVDYVEWNLKESTLSMRMKRNSPDPAEFKSFKYFNQGHYHKIQSILAYNPLNKVKEFAERNNSKTFSDEGFANFMGSRLSNIKRMLIRLGKEGFISYDIEVGEVSIQPKLLHYVKAEKDLTDFDNITFESVISAKDNAKLDMSTGDLNIEGVGRSSLSDSSEVRIFPENQQITIKEDLDAKFDGQMIAGRFQYYGDGFSFHYDSFDVKLDNIDSLRIYFPDEETGNMKAVDHMIEDISGSVSINHPNNKSGRVPMHQYPIFDCTEDAVVHYEKSYIYDKVYKKDSFYFEIDPFQVDSLKNFTRQGIQFDGTFHSANIFPSFDHQLTLMKDNSLGFTKRTPPEGYPMYNGKGTGMMEITLNKQGLRGAGQVDYLASTTESREFLLFPDSMNAVTQSFKIASAGQNKYPPVAGDKVYNHWKPYKDSMYIRERDPLTVYNEDFEFKGDLILTPDNLYGNGMFNYQNAEIESEALAFQPNQISADTASFKIKSDREGEPALYSSNVNFNLNLNSQILKGGSNFNDSLTSLNYHQYQTSIQKFTWDIEGKSVAMRTSDEQEMKEAFMESTDAAKDSLKFNSTAAYFDLNKYTIEAKNIPHIDLADAQAYPSNGEVLIKENSELKTLTDARIKADTNYFFHEFHNARINIKAQSKYFATADYFYKDRNGDKHKIHFKNIRVDGTGQTVAETTLPEEEDFPISPKFHFNGDINLEAKQQELKFDGKVIPSKLPSAHLGTQPITYNSWVYPDSIYIPYNEKAAEDQLTSGILIDERTKTLYPRFIGKKHNTTDKTLFEARGYLTYNYSDQQYEITTDSMRHIDSGSVHKLIFNANQLKLSTKGPINFNLDNESVNLKTAGIIDYNLKDSSHQIDLTMGLDFPFNPDAIKTAADSITNLAFYKPDSDDNRDAGVIGISHLIKKPEARQKVIDELRSFGTLISSESYQPNFLFSDLQLQWNSGRKAFVNDGKLGLGTMVATEINKTLDGHLALSIHNNKSLEFIVNGSEGNFYYFEFAKDKLKVRASDPFFMEKVNKKLGEFSDNNFTIEPLKDDKAKIFFQRTFEEKQN